MVQHDPFPAPTTAVRGDFGADTPANAEADVESSPKVPPDGRMRAYNKTAGRPFLSKGTAGGFIDWGG